MADELFYLPPADRLQFELAEVDEHMHLLFGRDESQWFPLQIRAYQKAIDAVWNRRPAPVIAVAA